MKDLVPSVLLPTVGRVVHVLLLERTEASGGVSVFTALCTLQLLDLKAGSGNMSENFFPLILLFLRES